MVNILFEKSMHFPDMLNKLNKDQRAKSGN